MYYLYGESAIDILLANGGMKEWKMRLRSRSDSPRITHWTKGRDYTPRCDFLQEERLHERAMYARRELIREEEVVWANIELASRQWAKSANAHTPRAAGGETRVGQPYR